LYFALHVLFVSHETFCFYQTVYIFIYSAYKLQVCSLNFCSVKYPGKIRVTLMVGNSVSTATLKTWCSDSLEHYRARK